MAIYHCSAHNISRSSGRTATASIAYRTGQKIKDERTGIIHDYTKKQGVLHTQIISNLNAQNFQELQIDRSQLWNLAEQSENRKDARTAKEFVIALPHELDQNQRKELSIDFAKNLVQKYGCIADVALHAPSKNGDQKNYHAHIMITTRKARLDHNGELVLTDKIDLELSNAKRKKLGLEPTTKEITKIRQDWEQIANSHLARAGRAERIDHRSYEEIGNGKQAQIHETPQITAMRRKGKQTEVSLINDQRRAYNEQIDRHTELETQKTAPTAPTTQNNILENAQNRLQARLKEREEQRRAEQERIQQENQMQTTQNRKTSEIKR